jgi:hypothetical protein
MSISIDRTNTTTILANLPRDITEIERQTAQRAGFAQLVGECLAFVFGQRKRSNGGNRESGGKEHE